MKPDLVESSEKYTMLWFTGLLRTGRLPGVKLRPVTIGMSHERMDENVSAYLKPPMPGSVSQRWYMKSFYFPSFDHHVTVSEHTAAELIAASHGPEVRRGIWISPMGVDSVRFTCRRKTFVLKAARDCADWRAPTRTRRCFYTRAVSRLRKICPCWWMPCRISVPIVAGLSSPVRAS